MPPLERHQQRRWDRIVENQFRRLVRASGVGDCRCFLRRNRLKRFVHALVADPELIGFGIDEQTALEVELRRGRVEALGDSYVLACVPARGERAERFEVLKHGDHTPFILCARTRRRLQRLSISTP